MAISSADSHKHRLSDYGRAISIQPIDKRRMVEDQSIVHLPAILGGIGGANYYNGESTSVKGRGVMNEQFEKVRRTLEKQLG